VCLLLRAGNFKCHCHFWSEVYSMVEIELKDEAAPVEREFKLRRRITVVLESYITVPLHLTCEVNNLG